MAGNQRNRESYGGQLAGVWVLIIIAAGVMVALGASGAAAAIIGASLVIGLAVASKR
jgi:hypothetical protein